MAREVKCIGCINIAENNFPFEDETFEGKKGFWIDTEGCGLVQNKDDYFLRIFFCPVCGKRLEKDKQREIKADPRLKSFVEKGQGIVV